MIHQESKYLSFNKEKNVLASMLFLTGLFAIIGGLYTWGDGLIINTPKETDLRIFIADILIAGPVSIIASIGLWKSKTYGLLLSWFVSGIYLYGSVAVYTMIIQGGPPYRMDLAFPPIIGICLAAILMYWTKTNFNKFL